MVSRSTVFDGGGTPFRSLKALLNSLFHLFIWLSNLKYSWVIREQGYSLRSTRAGHWGANRSMELGFLNVWASKKNYSQVVLLSIIH